MKISLEWLGQFLIGPLAAREAADALTNGGLPVETIEQVGADTVIDVEVTSNRSDCLSHIGVAKELAARRGIGNAVELLEKAIDGNKPIAIADRSLPHDDSEF